MDDLGELLDATDKSKRQECKPLSAKPSLSEMFLEATDQLKGTEMTPEQIRNYTLNRYNVDVIKCMNDINLLTRFSEIKVPTADNRKNRRITKCIKNQLKSQKVVRRFGYSDRKTEKLNLPKKRKIKPTKKVPAKKETRRRLGSQTKNKKASLRRKSTAQNDRWRSRTPLIKLMKNNSLIRKDFSPQTDILGHNSSVYERTASARPQIPFHDSLTRPIFGNPKCEILQQKEPNAPTGATTYDKSKAETKNYIHSNLLSEDNAEGCGPNNDRNSGFDNNPVETLPVKEASKIVSDKQNKRIERHGSLNSESKIMKAGYAVKHFIEGLSNKYASSLKFCNQRNKEDKHDIQRDKTSADFVYGDLQRDKVSVDLMNDSFQADQINPSFVNKDLTETKINTGLEHKDMQTDKVSSDSINKVAVESVPAIFLEMPAVKKLKNSRNSRRGGNKVADKFKVNKRRNNSRGVKEIEMGRKKALSEMKNGNTRAVKTVARTCGKIRLRNQYKIEPKTRLRTFENERKSVKEIPKHNKRTFSGTSVSLNSSNTAKRSKIGTKRTNAKVTLEEDWGEECNKGKLVNKDSCDPKNSNTDNRIERLRKLVEKRRLKKQVE